MKKNFALVGILAGSLALAAGIAAKPGKWMQIFDGKSTKGWHSYLKKDVQGWTIEDGTLMTNGKGGDLVTDQEFENFELEFEFKAQPKGNSGVIYKVIEAPENAQPYMSGPEFQVIDDVNYPAKLNDVQKTGANYDMIPPSTLSATKPAGEWNKGRILVNQNHVEHWLNGQKVVEYEYGTDAWKEMVAKSKFAKWGYAQAHAKGRLALQGHGDTAWFRNLRVREL